VIIGWVRFGGLGGENIHIFLILSATWAQPTATAPIGKDSPSKHRQRHGCPTDSADVRPFTSGGFRQFGPQLKIAVCTHARRQFLFWWRFNDLLRHHNLASQQHSADVSGASKLILALWNEDG